MNPLVKNPETGFLEAHNDHNSFTSDRKKEFLKIALDYVTTFREFPLIDAICDKIGIQLRTFDRHLKVDEVFKEEWNEVIAKLKAIYTNKLAIKADSKNGIVANLAILKYLETGSFVDRLQMVNSNDQMTIHKRINEAIIVDIEPETSGNGQPPA